ncbi:MAG TPA: hypothetical protein VGH38_26295 [Bryobacteraceae bacterium]|jgi:hypothetical protein
MQRLHAVIVVLGAASLLACHGHDISFTQQVVYAQDKVEAAKIAGKWQMSMDTPHGAVEGPLEVQQEGAKVTGTYTVEHIGTMPLSGTVDGKKVSLSVVVPGADVRFGFDGTVDGDTMSGKTEMGGGWKAARK